MYFIGKITIHMLYLYILQELDVSYMDGFINLCQFQEFFDGLEKQQRKKPVCIVGQVFINIRVLYCLHFMINKLPFGFVVPFLK